MPPLSEPFTSPIPASDDAVSNEIVPTDAAYSDSLHTETPDVASPSGPGNIPAMPSPRLTAMVEPDLPTRRLHPAATVATMLILVGFSAIGLHLNIAAPLPPAVALTPETAGQPGDLIFQLPDAQTPQPPANPAAPQPTPGTMPPAVHQVLPTPAPANVPANDPVAAEFEAAAALQKAGKNAEALAAYEKVLQQKPDLLPAHMNLAILYSEAKEPEKALPHLQAARNVDKANPALSFQMAQTLLQLQKVKEAEEPLIATVRMAPNNPQGWAMLGQVRLALKKPEAALQALVKASDIAPKDAGAAFTAGAVALDQLQKAESAEKYLRRAIALEPRDPRGPLYLGRALGQQKKWSAAETTLESAVKRFPKVPDLFTTLAQVRFERGDRSGGILALQGALRNVPESLGKGVPAGGLNADLGKQLAASGRWKEATAALSKAVRLLPREPEPSAMLVEAAVRSKNTGLAIRELRRSLKLNPKQDNARRTLARILADNGKVSEARSEYKTYLAAQPKDIAALGDLATLEEESKNDKAALDLWQKAAKQLPDNPLPHLQIARLLERSGKNSDAIRKYSYVLQIAPNDPNALWGIAKLEEKTRQTNSALTHLRTLVSTQPDFAPAYHPLLRISAARKQMPATLNLLTQKLSRSPEHPAAYYIVLDYFKDKDSDAGRKFVLNIIDKQPKAKAPRRALDEFDLAAAKKKLEELRNAKPTPAPSPIATPAKPTATPEKPDAKAPEEPKPALPPAAPETEANP